MSPDNHKRSPAEWMRGLLLASIALNVFMAGFIFARVLGPETGAGDAPRSRIELASLPPDLPPKIREEIEHGFRAHRKEVEKDYAKLVEAKARLGDLLRQEDLDEKELRKTLGEMSALQIEIQGAIQDSVVEAMRSMDPELRRIFFLRDDGGLERGLWSQRNFDGARWKVQFENGRIVLDIQGINDAADKQSGDDKSAEQ